MIRKIINFLDKHRIILVFLILILVVLVFLIVGSVIFWTHDFKRLNCTKDLNDEYCYYENKVIFKEVDKVKKEFFLEYKEEIGELQRKYDLPEFSNYTAYFYEVAALIDYNMYQGREDIYEFFHVYSETYQLESFYKKYNFYYSIFYRFKLCSIAKVNATLNK